MNDDAATPLEIRHDEDDVGGVFFIEKNGEVRAEMTYVRGGGRITIRHTEVDEALEGRGIGKRLVDAAVRWARARGMKIAATCPFAKAVLTKVKAYADVFVAA